jgi:hypothetical protein
MHDQGIFAWLEAQGRTGGVVRQITNPMAGTDTTLLALSGVGAKVRCCNSIPDHKAPGSSARETKVR